MKQGKNHGQSYGSGNSTYNGPMTHQGMLKDAKQIIQSTFWDFLE